jgi:hypothetical protein
MQYLSTITYAEAVRIMIPLKLETDFAEQMAANLLLPNLSQQHAALVAWGKNCTDRSQLQEWLLHLQLSETKKKDALLLRIAIRDSHQLAMAMPLLRFVLRANGASPLYGTAPRGPAFHSKKGS